MIHLAKHLKIPHTVTIACSGGVDSMAVVDFLRNGGRHVKIAYFHHGTEFGDSAEEFLHNYNGETGVTLTVGKIRKEKPANKSPEEHWRDERYAFLDSLNETVVMAHHLDDVVETWIFGSLHGRGKLIPWTRNKVIRPFLLTPKQELVDWCVRNHVEYLEDPSNTNTRYMRNLIRHKIMPHALKVNPGIRKTIAKKLRAGEEYNGQSETQQKE